MSLLLDQFRNTMTFRSSSEEARIDARLVDVLMGLQGRYFERVPDAKRVFELMSQRGDIIKNDHIAFRSVDIRSLLTVFLHYDYEVQFDTSDRLPMNFPGKKLTAVWLKHPNPSMPRIFVSEFRFDEGTESLRAVLSKYLDQLEDPIDHLDLDDVDAVVEYLHTGNWPLPSYSDYQAMQSESEYVAWVFYNKYYLNHFTLTVNELSSFEYKKEILDYMKSAKESDQSLQDTMTGLKTLYESHMRSFNKYLESNGFVLNKPKDNDLNISADRLLLQSSTKSNMIQGEFPDGNYEIPGSYVEFAYRGYSETVVESILMGDRSIESLGPADCRDGFEVGNADKIFESTYVSDETQNDIDNAQPQARDFYLASCEKLWAFLDTL